MLSGLYNLLSQVSSFFRSIDHDGKEKQNKAKKKKKKEPNFLFYLVCVCVTSLNYNEIQNLWPVEL